MAGFVVGREAARAMALSRERDFDGSLPLLSGSASDSRAIWFARMKTNPIRWRVRIPASRALPLALSACSLALCASPASRDAAEELGVVSCESAIFTWRTISPLLAPW